jgi:hypothetical protein
MIPTAPLADALLIPQHFKVGSTQKERIASINRIAYPLLGVDPAAGEWAWIRTQACEGRIFVTKDGNDSLYFPSQHPLRGQKRYHWIEDANGVLRGYMTPSAKADRENQHAG